MIAAGREKEIEEIRQDVSLIAPELPGEWLNLAHDHAA